MKGELYNYREIVEETKDCIGSKGYQFWKEQEALKKKQSNANKEWLIGYGACLTKISKAFEEIMEKHKTVNDGEIMAGRKEKKNEES